MDTNPTTPPVIDDAPTETGAAAVVDPAPAPALVPSRAKAKSKRGRPTLGRKHLSTTVAAATMNVIRATAITHFAGHQGLAVDAFVNGTASVPKDQP